MFNQVQNHGMPTEPITPDDITFMGCTYDEKLHPILLIQTIEKEYSFRLSKTVERYDLYLPLQKSRVDNLITYMKAHGLLRKKELTKDHYTLIDFASMIWVNWECIRIMQYLHITNQCESADINSTYQLRGYPMTKTILKFVDEEHLSDFRYFLATFKKGKRFADILKEKYAEVKRTPCNIFYN